MTLDTVIYKVLFATNVSQNTKMPMPACLPTSHRGPPTLKFWELLCPLALVLVCAHSVLQETEASKRSTYHMCAILSKPALEISPKIHYFVKHEKEYQPFPKLSYFLSVLKQPSISLYHCRWGSWLLLQDGASTARSSLKNIAYVKDLAGL